MYTDLMEQIADMSLEGRRVTSTQVALSCSPTQGQQHHHYLSCERMGGESGDDQGSMLTPFNIISIIPYIS